MNSVDPTVPGLVSIVVPTYNRAQFLDTAFSSIRAQTYSHWELIVVDDGSTDHTADVVKQFADDVDQPVQYLCRENGGAAAARNSALDYVQGEYIAFLDSDDAWLPHHLERCVEALIKHDEVDWVYAACRKLDYPSQRELTASSFYTDSGPRPFLSLRARPADGLNILDDPRTGVVMIKSGIMCGLQTSVMRRTVFSGVRLPPYRIAEDQIFAIQSLKRGHTFAYFDDIHVDYYVHTGNVSAGASQATLDKRLATARIQLQAYEESQPELNLTAQETRAIRQRLCRECFWTIGYSLLWENGHRREALAMFRRGLRYWPWSLRCWKTYCVAWVRNMTGRPRYQTQATRG